MRFGYTRSEVFAMGDDERFAEIIGIGEAYGGVWDWDMMEFSTEPKWPTRLL